MKRIRQIWLYRWPTACVLSLLLLAHSVWREGLPALAEYGDIQRQTAKQRQELALWQSFAARHGDYEGYIAEQSKELAALQSSIRAAGDMNASQSAVQEAALANGVMLAEMSAASGAAVKLKDGYQERRLRLQAEGDYYALLRWLRQLERQGLAVGELRLQGEEESGRVHAEILLKTYGIEKS